VPRPLLAVVVLTAALVLPGAPASAAGPDPAADPFTNLVRAVDALDRAAAELSDLLWRRRSLIGLLTRHRPAGRAAAHGGPRRSRRAAGAPRRDRPGHRRRAGARPGPPRRAPIGDRRAAHHEAGRTHPQRQPPARPGRPGPELALATRAELLDAQLGTTLDRVWAEAGTGALTPDDAAAEAALIVPAPAPGRLTATVDRAGFLRGHSPVTGPALWGRLELWEAATSSAVERLRRSQATMPPEQALGLALGDLTAMAGPGGADPRGPAVTRARLALERVRAELPPEQAAPLAATAIPIIGELPSPDTDPLLAGRDRPGGAVAPRRPPPTSGTPSGAADAAPAEELPAPGPAVQLGGWLVALP
jgi:hypothetical protein